MKENAFLHFCLSLLLCGCKTEMPRGMPGARTERAELGLSAQIAPVVALCVMCKSMLFSARAKAAGRIVRDPVRLASLLARLTSFGALAEFLLNPLFGKLSDTYGRKAILPLGPLSPSCATCSCSSDPSHVAAGPRTGRHCAARHVFLHDVALPYLMC